MILNYIFRIYFTIHYAKKIFQPGAEIYRPGCPRHLTKPGGPMGSQCTQGAQSQVSPLYMILMITHVPRLNNYPET